MSRRSKFVPLVPLILVVAYFATMSLIRGHVDGLIEHTIGQRMPVFSLRDRSGKVWSNKDLDGRRAVLHFFRSFCGACQAEAPALRAFEAKLPADVVLLHVMTDEVLGFEATKTAETLAREGFRRPVLMADKAFVDAFHQVQWSKVTPVTYVVDATGVVRFGLRGAQTAGTLDAALLAVR